MSLSHSSIPTTTTTTTTTSTTSTTAILTFAAVFDALLRGAWPYLHHLLAGLALFLFSVLS